MLRSDCCGARPKSNGDSDTSDIGICPDCGEHCEYIDEEDYDLPENATGFNDRRADIHEQRDSQIANQKLK